MGLSSELVLQAYRRGFFPMADSRDGPISWYSPDPRGIIPLDAFHIPRSLRRVCRQPGFDVRINTAFASVIVECGERSDTWISREIIDAYVELHRRGHAHSVEAWAGDALVGGLYGVSIGGAFFGESMFSRVSEASKVTLVTLVSRLQSRSYRLLDTQLVTPHLEQFGAKSVSRDMYLSLLQEAMTVDTRFVDI
jgi:leucyl/phenylalanyl-tRNA---protein transferase